MRRGTRNEMELKVRLGNVKKLNKIKDRQQNVDEFYDESSRVFYT